MVRRIIEKGDLEPLDQFFGDGPSKEVLLEEVDRAEEEMENPAD